VAAASQPRIRNAAGSLPRCDNAYRWSWSRRLQAHEMGLGVRRSDFRAARSDRRNPIAAPSMPLEALRRLSASRPTLLRERSRAPKSMRIAGVHSL
jgi:hypothetical protein